MTKKDEKKPAKKAADKPAKKKLKITEEHTKRVDVGDHEAADVVGGDTTIKFKPE